MRESGRPLRASETCADGSPYARRVRSRLVRAIGERSRSIGETAFEGAQATTGRRNAAGAIPRDARTLSRFGFAGPAVAHRAEFVRKMPQNALRQGQDAENSKNTGQSKNASTCP
jgi:hypothetical protein